MTALTLPMEFLSAADPAAVAAVDGSMVAALVERARQGDPAAFAAVVAQFEKRTFHFVLGMVGNSHDAEDITQETFVKTWQALRGYRPQNSFCTWLFTIARRTALNHLRARRPTEELKDHDISVEENPGDTMADRDDASAIWATARRLPPDQYDALRLCYGEGFAVKEVARIMNSNSIRIRVLLHRARRRMAEWLKPESPEPRNAPRS
jgi:RNA polymerase sigma-70 factor (ECF subfamily)